MDVDKTVRHWKFLWPRQWQGPGQGPDNPGGKSQHPGAIIVWVHFLFQEDLFMKARFKAVRKL